MSAAGPLATPADRAALAEVLAGPEFQSNRWRGEDLRRWLAGWWERLTELLGTAEAERWAGAARVVFLTAVLVGLLLLWRAVRQRRAGGAPGRTRAPAAATAAAGPDVAAALAAAARELEASRAAEAVRLAFLAATRAVGGRLRAAGVEALTGRELAGLVGDVGFGRLAGLHERTVFGRYPVTLGEARGALEVAARLAGAAAPPAAGPRRRPGRGEGSP